MIWFSPRGISLLVVFIALAGPTAAQTQTDRQLPPGALEVVEATTITQGWAFLAQGDVARARAIVDQALDRYPTHPAVVALAIEVAIAETGWAGGLQAYEDWQRYRIVDDFFALRRVVRAVLIDAVLATGNSELRDEAAEALWRGGEPGVATLLRRAGQPARPADLGALAVIGDAQSVNALIAMVESGEGDRVSAIRALGRSRSAEAVATLRRALESPRPEVRISAAEALGRLDARSAIPDLETMLTDEIPAIRLNAAAALYRMGDYRGISVLQLELGSPVSAMRLEAARAMAPVRGQPADPTWLRTVRDLMSDTDPAIRVDAAALIADFDPAAARNTIDQLTRHSSLAVREHAERVLPLVMGANFGELRALLHHSNPLIRVRAAARIFEWTR